ncbi:hypothetical protein EU555_33005 [Methylobacterium nonmethylotrophicum]|uniref:Uncharacterized protein n=1 Tax=Methylobacterium nonmethylotrophicum TaxID=1141884 RepID=A0A4Z0NE73_9HYPH|nr:hypothetical protein EU555_33005 [Methylobacterium nonmethylotrophicum]
MRDQLTAALAGFRNRDAAFALATWLARFWSAPRKLLYAFPVDRRAIAGREDLGLTEARVRGALAALEEIGFLARYEPDPGKRYQRTAKGLHRRPLLFRFGEEYAVAFTAANARAQAARGAPAPARRPIPRPEPQRAPAANVVAPVRPAILPGRPTIVPASQLAQKQAIGGSRVIMGEERRAESSSPLEAALARLGRGLGL